jgi:hypothetical protein
MTLPPPLHAEDAEDGPPELLFVHGGHTARTTVRFAARISGGGGWTEGPVLRVCVC